LFNDQQALLTPTYITTSILLLCLQIPLDVTNAKDHFSMVMLLHEFVVQLKPTVNSMLSEFVNEGDLAVIRGDYFCAPVSVMFTGGIPAK
jgi:hypothetical protein